jgi:hypothetical protein
VTFRSRAVDTVFNVLELFAATCDLVRKLQRRVRRDTDPIFPLTHKDSERIAEFGRRAGHETGPIPKAPRVPKI